MTATLESAANHTFLTASSLSSTIAPDIHPSDLDVLILCASAQSRAVAVLAGAKSTSRLTLIIGGLLEDEQEQALLNDGTRTTLAQMRTFAGSSVRRLNLSLATKDRHATFASLMSALHTQRAELGRPLRLGIDLTTCPEFFSLGIVAQSLRAGYARSVSVLYTEGRYPEVATGAADHELFTVGEWDVEVIPGLSRPWSPGQPRVYVLAVGFEGGKTLRLCERREPDRIVVLFPEPGVIDGYVDRTRQQNSALFERFGVEDSHVLKAPAADAVKVWNVLCQHQQMLGRNADVELLCCGTKPHGLGMCLFALSTGIGVVCEIVAERSMELEVTSTGVFWRYDITNTAVL